MLLPDRSHGVSPARYAFSQSRPRATGPSKRYSLSQRLQCASKPHSSRLSLLSAEKCIQYCPVDSQPGTPVTHQSSWPLTPCLPKSDSEYHNLSSKSMPTQVEVSNILSRHPGLNRLARVLDLKEHTFSELTKDFLRRPAVNELDFRHWVSTKDLVAGVGNLHARKLRRLAEPLIGHIIAEELHILDACDQCKAGGGLFETCRTIKGALAGACTSCHSTRNYGGCSLRNPEPLGGEGWLPPDEDANEEQGERPQP